MTKIVTDFRVFSLLIAGGMAMIKKVFDLYYDGFRSMVIGKTLWKIILIKLLIMFAVLKVFFFPNYLATNFENDAQRANHVLDNLTRQ